MNVVGLPVFETERLILREVTLADAPAYQCYFADYDVIKNLTVAVPWPYPEGGAREHILTQIMPRQGKDKWTWGLFLKDNPEELIGALSLERSGTPGNRGFWLGKPFWGQGFMTEAVVPIMDYAFDSLGFEQLIFANAVGNTKSRRIKEKTGATLLYSEPYRFVGPEFTEHEVWELKKESWQEFRRGAGMISKTLGRSLESKPEHP